MFKTELQKHPIHPGPGEPHADSRSLPSLYFKGSEEPAKTLAEADRVADSKAQGLVQRRAETTAPLPCVRLGLDTTLRPGSDAASEGQSPASVFRDRGDWMQPFPGL